NRLAEAAGRRGGEADQGVSGEQSEDAGSLEDGSDGPIEKLSRRDPSETAPPFHSALTRKVERAKKEKARPQGLAICLRIRAAPAAATTLAETDRFACTSQKTALAPILLDFRVTIGQIALLSSGAILTASAAAPAPPDSGSPVATPAAIAARQLPGQCIDHA